MKNLLNISFCILWASLSLLAAYYGLGQFEARILTVAIIFFLLIPIFILGAFLSSINADLRAAYMLITSIILAFACYLYITVPKSDAMGGVALFTVPMFAGFLIVVLGLFLMPSNK